MLDETLKQCLLVFLAIFAGNFCNIMILAYQEQPLSWRKIFLRTGAMSMIGTFIIGAILGLGFKINAGLYLVFFLSSFGANYLFVQLDSYSKKKIDEVFKKDEKKDNV